MALQWRLQKTTRTTKTPLQQQLKNLTKDHFWNLLRSVHLPIDPI